MIYEFFIYGRPIVKKNNQKVSCTRRFPVKYNTPAYNEWVGEAKDQLLAAGPWDKPAIDYPVNFRCLFFMPTRGRVDLSALYEAPQDLLVEIGVLADDNSKVVASHDGSGVFYDKENPRMEVRITKK